jgi:hypothetical protein
MISIGYKLVLKEKAYVVNADVAIVASMHHRFAELEGSYVVPTERLPSIAQSSSA